MAQLRGYIDEAVTTIQVDDTTNLLVDGGIVQIEDEKILYERATDKAILGCSRGYDSTTAVEHDDHTEVEPIDDTLLPAYRLPEFQGTETPVDLQTGVLQAEKGSRYTNITNGKIYVNVTDPDLPEWVELADTGDFTPAGDTTEIQYNNAGALGASADLTFDDTTNVLRVGTDVAHVYVDGANQKIGTYADSTLRIDTNYLLITPDDATSTDISGGTVWTGTPDNSTEVYLDGTTGESYMMGSLLIGDDASAAATAALELKSTTKGILLSRPTTAQRDLMGTPATGTVVVVDYSVLAGVILTVGGTALTEGVEWTAATDNPTTAASLNSAIDALSTVSSTVASATITITASVVTGSNSIGLVSTDAVNLTVSGATLAGEVKPAEGLLIYNTTTNKLNFYTGAAWEEVTSA